jgi:hypothetical protein
MSAPGFFRPPHPVNEPILDYAPGAPERAALRRKLEELRGQRQELPLVIGGEDVRTGRMATAVVPHDHRHVLADVHQGGSAEVERAIDAAALAWPDWSRTSWVDRASVFLRAAELLAGPWRQTLNAATMLGQSKTAHQAEVDSACELIDFLRFNVEFMCRIYEEQPVSSTGTWNRMEYRPLEGFVFAVTPFNFTAIAGNLPVLGGADGEHGRVEARRRGDAVRVLRDAAAGGGGPPARRHQPRLRRRPGGGPDGARASRLRRAALHRVDPRVPGSVADGRQRRRPLSNTTRAPPRIPTKKK